MAVKKSELYSSLWAGCDELRGSMDASQYKDYVLVLLFMKYVFDKGDRVVEIPAGASFNDMVKLKGQPDIGDKINKIIGEFAKANDLNGIITVADFNDDEKLGRGKAKVERLSNLIEIFENEALDFRSNRAANDDLLGDAYEFLMRHFATESGKSKGQFYTPAEVSRIMAKVIGIDKSLSQSETLYDPTCGSGSLLLKAAGEAPHGISIYGQENDNATRALCVMNMWLHGTSDAEIELGNTLSDPKFKDEQTGKLKLFNYIVANPPFSYKTWGTGVDAANDLYQRFDGYGIPPRKNGDYAFLLHLIKSLKSKGKAAMILPLGVLFRGNSEGEIRKNIINRGYIKGIIALPPNLFYGTGIAASIIIIDKEKAVHRKGIFMIDASKGFMKDGNKNRLCSQDIHKIVDVFNRQLEVPKYSRMIPLSEISDPKNDYNLNIPRYIDSQEEEDIQDIEAHLRGGIPSRDIEGLQNYWNIYPHLRKDLFKQNEREDYQDLKVIKEEIKSVIFEHPEFREFSAKMERVFIEWKNKNSVYLKALAEGCQPKAVIQEISEDILLTYTGKELIDRYDIYQHLMDYWDEIMQDDLYELAADGWKAGKEVKRIIKKVKTGGKIKEREMGGIAGLEGQLIPPALIISEYFAAEQIIIDNLQSEIDTVSSLQEELQDENSGEEGLLADVMDDNGKFSKKLLTDRLRELGRRDAENAEEWEILNKYRELLQKEARLKAELKIALDQLEMKIIGQYPRLSLEEIKSLVVDKKWMAAIENRIKAEMDAISYRLTERIKELAERYETPLPQLAGEVENLTEKVEKHLKDMGYVW
jgi:type I restriction enzyme M protein